MAGEVSQFLRKNFLHFNAASLIAASDGWRDLLDSDGKMFLTLAGAMSTAELGISLAELIRQNKVHAITCTGANLEEDVFNLVAHDFYHRIPDYRSLKPQEEAALRDKGMNRVTDTCIPEEEAMLRIDKKLAALWQKAEQAGERYFPHEFIYQLLDEGDLDYQIDSDNSWLLAAKEKNLPIFVPGWEDSTTGNYFAAEVIRGNLKDHSVVKSGTEQMQALVEWYLETTKTNKLGFFQIGGGIAGDFPICAVPLVTQDLRQECPLWSYFCQISDSTTSYGSYSGAVPNEKITWGKLDVDTPSFIIESDATIVAPLVFALVLGV